MISVSTAQYGILLMKFWNDTQISGVIYFQNAQEFI